MNIFEKEILKKYEDGYVEGMEYYKRRIFKKLIVAIYYGYSEEMIEMLIELGWFDEDEVQKAYKYFENGQLLPKSGVLLGKFIDWRVRSEIVIPTEKMSKSVYLTLTTKAISKELTEYINNLVELDSEYKHLKRDLNYQSVFLKERLEECNELLGKIK